ncbi:hypothetical protein [Maridesulfovibrio sp.]|uniref:hypothetical protein n=1 Tax=Maridesulfovibrio sp. TaxID=2795000 RepID=UPI0029CA3CAA|nr:hypothetical protein [Maridesulfovibrio sp.]
MSWEIYAAQPLSRKIYTLEVQVSDPANPTAERETLYFSSDAIDPALCEFYHAPCIKSLPVLTRSVQALTLGRTVATYGNCALITASGHLDDSIRNRDFAGAPVSIKLGFGGLNNSEFKEIFSGRVGPKPAWDDVKLTLPLVDGVRDLLDKKIGSDKNLSGTLPTVVSGLLDDAGIVPEKRDSAFWDAWATENNFNVWLPVTKNQSVGSVLDILLAPLGCWFGFSRAGLFRVSTFAAPVAEADPVLNLSDIELFKFNEADHGKRYWKISVVYYSATGDNADTAERSWEDSALHDANPSAEEVTKKTALTSSTDADTIRDRWKDLFSVRRLVASCTAHIELFALNIGDHVRVTRDRLDVDHVYRVQKISDDMTKNQVKLELFR